MSNNKKTGRENAPLMRTHAWQRDPRNPVLPPQEWFDCKRVMNPFVVLQEDQYYIFYAGADQDWKHRICLATAPVHDVGNWTRHGPVLEPQDAGSFDEAWCVLPCVHRIGGRWHLYYTGKDNQNHLGLQSFSGIGLAISDDLRNWTRYSCQPVLQGDGFAQWPNNKGIAGGGSILEIPQEDGRILYRMYYTLAVGTPSKDLLVDQAKYSVVAHSWDGIEWFDRRIVMGPRLDAEYENAATIALNVWQTTSGWRGIYAGIGSQFGAYAICEAVSVDGLHWERGRPGENLSLQPQGDGWESKMTEYPNIIEENGRIRLFYCGNGYGMTGIGTAIADKL
jgi:hypothetical protein